MACNPKATYKEKKFYDSKEYVEFIDIQFTAIETKISILNASFKDNVIPSKPNNSEGSDIKNTSFKAKSLLSRESIIKYNYARLLQSSDSAMLVLNSLSAFGDDEGVKKSSEELCIFYNNIFHNEYRTLLEFYLSDNTPGEAQLDSIYVIVSDIIKTEDSLKNNYRDASELLILKK